MEGGGRGEASEGPWWGSAAGGEGDEDGPKEERTQLQERLLTRPQAERRRPHPSQDHLPEDSFVSMGGVEEGVAARLGGLRTEQAAHRRKSMRARQTRG